MRKSNGLYGLIFLMIALLLWITPSCKKGEEDPFLSIYSRKHRLCQDWEISNYKKVVQHMDTIISEEYEGSSLWKVIGNDVFVFNAEMSLSFKKNGTYNLFQKITTDSSYSSISEDGNWYFTGGGKDSDTKNKELLAMQRTKVTETRDVNGNVQTSNYYGTGDNDAYVFKIIKLSSDNVILKSYSRSENILSQPYYNDLNIVSMEFDLMKKP